jgi:adenylate cyclase
VVTLAGSAAVREGAEADVASAIAEAFEALDAGFGYSSAAAGPDLLFVEAMLARGGEAHIVLPFDRQDFVGLSVASAGEGWVQRFDRALAGATTVGYAVREGFLGDRSLFRYAETLTRGAAMLRAEQLERAPVVLTLPGGVDDATLAQWRARGLEVGVLDVEEATGPAKPVSAFAGGLEREVKTMLFADVVGFTRLREEETPAFLVEFLGSIAEIVRTGVVRPAFVNTWGDGLFMVFDDVAAGADAALRVRDKVLGTDWRARGLPESTSVRVGMHSGPVFPATDPLLGRANFFGSHVNRAARIEPVAAPGTVYVSEAMACLLAASGEVRFATDYLGTIPLAKGFDSSPLYRLRRADAAE